MEEAGGARGRHAVEEDLHEVGAMVPRAEALAGVDQRPSHGIEPEDVVVDRQARHHPGIQLARLVQGAQRLEDLQRDGRVLEGRDAVAREQLDPTARRAPVLRRGERPVARVGLRDGDARRLQEHPGGMPVAGVEHRHAAVGQVPGVDARQLQGAGVGPAVVPAVVGEHDGMPVRRFVETRARGRRRQLVHERAGPRAARDPRPGGQGAGALADECQDLVEAERGAERQLEQVGDAGDRVVVVHVDESGVERRPREVPHERVGTAMGRDLGGRSDRQDAAARDGHGLGAGALGVGGADGRSGEDEFGAHLSAPADAKGRTRRGGRCWTAGVRGRRT